MINKTKAEELTWCIKAHAVTALYSAGISRTHANTPNTHVVKNICNLSVPPGRWEVETGDHQTILRNVLSNGVFSCKQHKDVPQTR